MSRGKETTVRNRLILAAGAAALTVLGTACSGPTAEPAAPSSPTPRLPDKVKTLPKPGKVEPLADPDSARRIVYAPGLVSDPLPARARNVGVKSGAIADKAKRKSFGATLQPGQAETSLRSVAIGEGARARPSWVLTWRNSQPAVKGPTGRTQADNQALADKLECVFVLVVDANSGADLDARQLCQAKQ